MKPWIIAAAASSLFASAPVLADATLDLAKAKECTLCHDVSKDTIAPSFKSIAAKYKKQADAAQATLVPTIMKGTQERSGPHWGTSKMPPTAGRVVVSKAEAGQLADWILKQ